MKITTVYLTKDQDEKLKELAKKRGGQRVSELVRKAIDELLERMGK